MGSRKGRIDAYAASQRVLGRPGKRAWLGHARLAGAGAPGQATVEDVESQLRSGRIAMVPVPQNPLDRRIRTRLSVKIKFAWRQAIARRRAVEVVKRPLVPRAGGDAPPARVVRSKFRNRRLRGQA